MCEARIEGRARMEIGNVDLHRAHVRSRLMRKATRLITRQGQDGLGPMTMGRVGMVQ